jgi:di/tripeptidase
MRSLDEPALVQFEETVARLSVSPPLDVSVDVVGRRPAGRLDRGHPLLRTVRAAREELGLADALGAGSTDANAALALGIPALAIGVSFGTGMHSLDERIETASLELGRVQLARILARLLGSER